MLTHDEILEAESHIKNAISFVKQKCFDAAIHEYEEAIKIVGIPNSWDEAFQKQSLFTEVYLLLGELYAVKKKNFSKAISYLDIYRKCRPNDKEANDFYYSVVKNNSR